MKAWRDRFRRFFFEPGPSAPLALLRISVAALLLLQALALRTSILDLFASDGIIQKDLAAYLSEPGQVRLQNVETLLSPLSLSDHFFVYLFCIAYTVSLSFLLIGFFSRSAAAFAWVFHWILMETGFTATYGVDLYAHVFLFYLTWSPAGDMFSLDSCFWGARPRSVAAQMSLRCMQLHLCITYFFSAVEKGAGIQWWNGELMWRALSLPVYHQFDFDWLAGWPILSKIGGWITLILEGGYCVLIWPGRTRWFWVTGIALMHLGIAVFLGLGFFGVFMAMLTVCIFGAPAAFSRGQHLSKSEE